MKELFNKVKNFFKGVLDKISKHTNSDGYNAFLIFIVYVSLFLIAVSFLAEIFQAVKFGSALFVVAGSYISIRIIYNFSKDFIRLIKLYILDKNKDGEK